MPDENGNNLNDGTEFRIVAPNALEALERAEIDIAITTAKRYPRDIAQSLKMCKELALRNQAIAKTCNYAVPRAGKMIVGPSVHFARMVAYSWGNQTSLARLIGCDRDNAHLQGVFHDLQTNARIGIEMDWPVQPPRTDTPERWRDQMNLAKRAGSAVALRTAIFNCIPMALFVDISETAKLVAVGDGKTFLESRDNAGREFKDLGVSWEQLFAYLDVGGLESINTDHLIHLHGILQSIRDHTLSVADVFGRKEDKFDKAKAPERRPPEKEEISARGPRFGGLKEPAARKTGNSEPKDIMEDAGSAEEAKKTKPEAKSQPAVEKSKKMPDLQAKGEAKPEKPPPPPEPLRESLLDQVRDKLEQAKVPETRMVAWLQAVDVMKPAQTTLDKCSDEHLAMLLGQWAETLELMGQFSAEEEAAAKQ